MIRKNIRFLSIVFLFWFAQYIFNPFFSPYLEELEIAATLAGLIIGAYGFSQLLLRIPFGISADRLRNHKLFMMGGLLCLCVSGVLLYFAQSSAAFLVARFFSGAAASTWVSFTVFFTNCFPKEDTERAVATIMLANNFGVVLSYILGTISIDMVGVRGLFLMSAGAALLGAVLMVGISEEWQSGNSPISIKDVFITIKDKNLLCVSMLTALAQMIIFASALSFTANFAEKIGAYKYQLGIISIFFNSASVAASFWMSFKISTKITNQIKIVSAFVLVSISCFIVPNCTSVVGIYVAQILCGIGRGIILSLTMALALRDILPQFMSTAMGTYQSIYSLGMTIGPMIMGFALNQAGNYQIPYYLSGGMGLAGAVLSVVYVKKQKV